MGYVRLVLALVCLAVSLLTWVKAPGLWGWKLAVVATEFGHFASVLPLGTAAWLLAGGRNRPVLFWVSLAACFVSFGLFMKPSLQAAALSASLNQRLSAVTGDQPGGEAFSWRRLFRIGTTNTAEVRTLTYRDRGEGGELALDFYPARSAGRKAPCVLVIHGGGWDSGSREEIVGFNHWLAGRGFAVAAMEYRLAPDAAWPAQLDDVRAALGYLQERAGALGIDGGRMALFGRSAGGQIATAAAPELRDTGLRCVAAFYAPHDLVFAWEYAQEGDVLNSLKLLEQYLGGGPEQEPAAYQLASAYLKDAEALRALPTLLVHGRLDTLVWVEQSRRYAEKLDSVDARFLYLELPWATHGFEFNQNGPGGQLALHALERFLESALSESK